MAVTIVKRPTGHKIIDQAIAANITDSSGDALITFPYHGLGTGDTVYITSDIDEYNGFFYVTAIDVNTFKISEYDGADFVEYYQDLDIDYYQTQEHDWNAIFLPIVYKLTNDRWPVNSIDTTRTVSSQSDDNGFTNLNLSGVLKSAFNALEFVKIIGAADEDLNGVWQIVEVISTSDITINLPYLVSNSFIGATVQYYYNNYQVKVKINAGLNASHPWASKKPYEEVAELSLTPDDNNEVMFSVSDYITLKVAIKNNLTLFSLPLNLDAFTQFLISTAESFDDSDNYSLTTSESAFTDDSFEGYAVAGKLPFKNLYSGGYADYIYTPGSPALWLTVMDRLLAVEDHFFDVSFIKNLDTAFRLEINKYVADYLTSTEIQLFANQGIGVYRLPIVADTLYDSFCITIKTDITPIPMVFAPFDDWQNSPTGDADWDLFSCVGPCVTIPAPSGVFPDLSNQSAIWYVAYLFIPGNTYSITFNYTKTDGAGVPTNPRTITLGIYDSLLNFIEGNITTTSVTDPVTEDITYSFTADETHAIIGLVYSVGSERTLEINSVVGTSTYPEVNLTEEICIDILESCEVTNQVVQGDRRLLEDGSYRLLE